MNLTETELKNKLEVYLSKRLNGNAIISEMYSLSGGACQDNYLLDLRVETGESQKDYQLVFRTDKGASLLTSLSRQNEYKVAEIANQNSVNTPKPYWLETDSSVLGNPFYFMQRISGKATGRYIVKDPSLNKIRNQFIDEIALGLSNIHKITEDKIHDSELLKILTRGESDLKDSIAKFAVSELKDQISTLSEAHPAMSLILNWLEQNLIETDNKVLVHGDFRTGNFMANEKGLQGIVDWEFAHIGDRHEDIAWLCMRDWRFGKLKKEVGGFAMREEFYSLYKKYSGVEVDTQKVLYWEVMGNLRWAIGSVQQGERHISGKDKGIELASIGRRTCEMEMEAMRLIENAR
jgi:aminoglycoside phosphotransferase (APT) family kinase protein